MQMAGLQRQINPHIDSVTSITDPPDEKNGNAIPVLGTTPATTAQFSSDCKKITVVQPNAPSDAKRFLQRKAILYAQTEKAIKSAK